MRRSNSSSQAGTKGLCTSGVSLIAAGKFLLISLHKYSLGSAGKLFSVQLGFLRWSAVFFDPGRQGRTEMAAKQEGMKKKHVGLKSSALLPQIATGELVQSIRGELKLTHESMGVLAGVGPTTVYNWSEGSAVDQVQALFRLLARLPRDARHRIVDKACPCMPSLVHPYIARDRLLTSFLQGLLRNERGVTLVVGESDDQRTFLATAIAHSFAAKRPNEIDVSGYDVHDATWCVPIDGVTYLNVWKRTNGSEAMLRNCRIQPAGLIFLNGLYSRVSEIRTKVQKLSATCHVLLSERVLPVRELAHFHGPKHIVTVSLDRRYAESLDDAARMLIDVREASEENLPTA